VKWKEMSGNDVEQMVHFIENESKLQSLLKAFFEVDELDELSNSWMS
jgi:hypothetical protein